MSEAGRILKTLFAKSWKPALKVIVGIVVCAAVGVRLFRAWTDLKSKGELPAIDPLSLSLSGLLYLGGLAVLGGVYWSVLRAGSAAVPLGVALKAYFISHLGKYVPGKALVVVMRVALSARPGARKATAAYATFYETFVMMASGAVLAAGGLSAVGAKRRDIAIAVGLAAVFLVVVEPRVFRLLSRWMTLPFRTVDAAASLPKLTWRLLACGLAAAALGWCLLGASQLALLRGFMTTGSGISGSTITAVIAAVAFATVAGFAVPISPGGLGVRELILAEAIAPAVGGNDRAILAAVLLRIVWIVAEILAATAWLAYRPRAWKIEEARA